MDNKWIIYFKDQFKKETLIPFSRDVRQNNIRQRRIKIEKIKNKLNG